MRSTITNLIRRRHLLGVLVISNLKRQNKNSTLGHLWWLLDPVLLSAIYYFIVEILFRRGGENQPFVLFLVCGLLPWKAFSDSVLQTVNSIRGQASIVKAISFPKAVIPLSLVFSNTFFQIIAFLVPMGLGMLYGPRYGTWPTFAYLALPLVIGLQVLFTIGVVLIISTIGMFFQDISNIVGHLLRMWYFLSPGLYSMDIVPDRYLPIYRLNPFCELMTAYRDILMFGRFPAISDLGYAMFAGTICCLVGYFIFKRYEGWFVQKL